MTTQAKYDDVAQTWLTAELKQSIPSWIEQDFAQREPSYTDLKAMSFLANIYQHSKYWKVFSENYDSVDEAIAELVPETAARVKEHIKGWLSNTMKLSPVQNPNNNIATLIGLGNKKLDMDDQVAIELLKILTFLKNKTTEYLPNNLSLSPNDFTIGQYFQLNQVELEIMNFYFTVSDSSILNRIDSDIAIQEFNDLAKLLSIGLNLNQKAVQEALTSSGKLKKFKIMEFTGGGYRQLFNIDIDRNFSKIYFSDQITIADIEQWIAPIAPLPETSLENYFYLANEAQGAINILKQYANGKTSKAPQFLLYGLPGTGKTEFARLLAATVQKKALEVPFRDQNGSFAIRGRLDAFLRVADTMVVAEDCIIIFDEIEDIMPDESSKHIEQKALLNRQLERPKFPVIWISNSLDFVDDSLIRRFDYIIHFDYLSQEHCMAFLKQYTAPLKIEDAALEDISQSFDLVPSFITDACSQAIELGLQCEQASDFMRDRFNQVVVAMSGKKSEDKSKANTYKPGLLPYHPSLSQTSTSLDHLVKTLKVNSDAKLLFHGAPGTGKTAFANHLGEAIGRKTNYINASNLLNMFVGGTESNIREIFREAEKKKQILVIDEADSILRRRDGAVRSWEVTQVNQFLSCIENFNGIAIICTNFIDALDVALYRRFDIKIEFDYLTLGASTQLFKSLCEHLKISASDDHIESLLKNLKHLVPAYFNVIARRARFEDFPRTAEQLVKLLAEEQEWVNPTPNPVGFMN